jgi:hypothetical protein
MGQRLVKEPPQNNWYEINLKYETTKLAIFYFEDMC